MEMVDIFKMGSHLSLDRGLTNLVGWLFLVSGCAMVAVALIVPTSIENRELAWEQKLLREQARRLENQVDTYQAFRDAVQTDDPVLLQRLAFHQFRQKPRGTTMINLDVPSESPLRLPAIVPVERWLHHPMPTVGRDFPALEPLNSMLVKLTSGWSHYGVLIAAGCSLGIGLLYGCPSNLRLRQALRHSDLTTSAPDLSQVYRPSRKS